LSGPDKIVCSFEEDTCLFDDELNLNERWKITKSTVRKWDNTLNVGVYSKVYGYLSYSLVFFCTLGEMT